MIQLVNDTFSPDDTVGMMKTFANEEELWGHVQKRAHLSRIPRRQERLDEKWGFTYCSPQMLVDIMEDRQEIPFTKMAAQAREQEYCLIVIHQGESKPLFLLATPELDTVKLKHDWCKSYAKSHSLLIMRK
jgi:hypothetical protein